MNKSKPILEAAKKLKEEPAAILTKIIERINKNSSLLRNVKFYEDILKEKSNIETSKLPSTGRDLSLPLSLWLNLKF